MASPFVEKVQVAVITATVVSAGWIMVGAFALDRDESAAIRDEIKQTQVDAADEATQVTASSEQAPSGAPPDGEEVTVPATAETAQLVIPVMGVSADQLVDSFQDERGGGTRLHNGIDIMAEAGTSVIAAAPGTLVRMFRSDRGGNTVYVRSEDGRTIYYYAHLDDYAPGLTEGMAIRRSQRLGTVGSSGNADPAAPHLHFEVTRTTPSSEWWEPGNSVNPFPLLTRERR